LAVKINAIRGAQQETSVPTNVSKAVVQLQQEYPILGVWCKKWSNWTSGVGQKIRLRLPVLLGIRLYQKNLRLRNPAGKHFVNL